MTKSVVRAFLYIALLMVTSVAVADTTLPTTSVIGEKFYYYTSNSRESLYSIAKRMGWDYTTLVKWNPDAESGTLKGQRIFYPVPSNNTEQVTANVNEDIKPIVYKIRQGDTMYALARKYNTTVERIMLDNPGVSDKNFQAGKNINITPESNRNNYVTVNNVEDIVTGFRSIAVDGNSSWEGLAKNYGVSVETLRSLNSEVAQLKKGVAIAVPVIEQQTVSRQVPYTDPRELTAQGRQEIFDSIAISNGDNELRVVILLSQPSSKKDIDFSRGFLTALKRKKDLSSKVRLSFVKATDEMSKLLADTTFQNADLIISTFDKETPDLLCEFGQRTKKNIINVFDVKDTHYISNKYITNLLQPSDVFNTAIANYLSSKFEDATFIFVGDNSNGEDMLGKELKDCLPSYRVMEFASDDFISDYNPIGNEDVVFYIYDTKKTNIKPILTSIGNVRSANSSVGISTIGRPNWVVYADDLKQQFMDADTYIPSRFYYDESASESKSFTSDFKSLFSQEPVKSYPMYSVMGYDVAEYFINNFLENGAELLNYKSYNIPSLQINFGLENNGEYEGILNTNAYVIRFSPFGMIDKIQIK